MPRPLNLALVGCGAVAELIHLPAAAKLKHSKLTHLIDANMEYAKSLASRFGIAHTGSSVEELKEVDGAILCVPNFLHAPIACSLLQRGIHVLVEKPMACTVAQCEEMLAAEKASKASISVAMVWRYFRFIEKVKQILKSGMLGEIQSLKISAGQVYEWPTKSGTLFDKEKSGGGVLMDFGPHMLDLLRDWLGPLHLREYFEDAAGNVESECILKLGSALCQSVELHLSRLRSMTNQILIEGSAAKLELKTFAPDQLKLTVQGGPTFCLDIQEALPEAAELQLQAFESTIGEGAPPMTSSSQAMEDVALINQCYDQAKPLQHCWEKALV